MKQKQKKNIIIQGRYESFVRRVRLKTEPFHFLSMKLSTCFFNPGAQQRALAREYLVKFMSGELN